MYEVSAAAVCMFSCLVIQYLLGFLVGYPVFISVRVWMSLSVRSYKSMKQSIFFLLDVYFFGQAFFGVR